MSSIPLMINPTGGSAQARSTNAAPIFQQPIVVVGGYGNNGMLDTLNAITTLARTVGNQNAVIASQYQPIAGAAIAADTAGLPAANVSQTQYSLLTGSNSLLILGVVAVGSILLWHFLKH